MAWTDNFDRADGPIDNGWVCSSNGASIVGGYPGQNSTPPSLAGDATGAGDHTATIQWTHPGGSSWSPYVVVKSAYPSLNFYRGALLIGPTSFDAYIVKVTNNSPVVVAQVNGIQGTLGTVVMTLSYSGGALTLTVNGTQRASGNDNTWAANTYCGMQNFNPAMQIDYFTTNLGITRSISVSPDPMPAFGTEVRVTVTGTSTEWTAGVPGSSTVTADHGAISEQVTMSATEIQFWYNPADYVGPIVFTESQYGLQDTVNASADPETFPDLFACLLTPEGAALINDTAASRSSPILTEGAAIDLNGAFGTVTGTLGAFWRTLAKLVDPEGEPGAGTTYINILWDILNGGNPPVVNESIYDELLTTRNTANHVEEMFNGALPDTWITILQLRADLLGLDSRDLTEVYDHIGAVDLASATTILDAIQGVLDDQQATATWLSQVFTDMRGEGVWGFGDVNDWINAARGEGLPTIKAVLDKLNADVGEQWTELDAIWHHALMADTHSSNNYDILYNLTNGNTQDIDTILTAIGNIPAGGNEDVLAAIAAMVGVPATTLAAILAKLNEIRGDDATTLKAILEAAQADPNSPNYTIPALLALLAAALAGNLPLIAALGAKLAAGKLDLMLDIIEAISGLGIFLHSLYDHFNPASPTYAPFTAPIYPGLDRVTLLDPVPFENGVNLALRMDGALIDISTPGEHPYAIKNTQPTRYGRLGTFAFACDVQRLEAIQPIQYLNFVATPKAIASPTGIVVQCKQGTVGTVIPYLLA